MTNPAVRGHFGFNDADLLANRNGRLSQRQVDKRLADAKNTRPAKIGCGFGLLLVASAFPISFGLLLVEEWGNWGAILPVACVTLIWVAAWGGLGIGIIRSALLPPVMELASVSGAVNIVGVERRTTTGSSTRTYTAYELRIGDKKFDVDAKLGNLIRQDDHYAVYYIKDTQEIISLEEIPP
jgi:hypothetical protein